MQQYREIPEQKQSIIRSIIKERGDKYVIPLEEQNNECNHEWKDIYTEEPDTFLGVNYVEKEFFGRICTKCFCVEVPEMQQRLDDSPWAELSKAKSKIVRDLIIDKGEYFLIPLNKKEK